ncbi:MAG TPA: DUF4179 domain-containing protein [Anaerolineales bacterium]
MNDYTPFTQLEAKIRAAVAVPQALPEFVNRLQTDLMHQADLKNRKALRPFYLRPAWIAFLTVITLLIASTLIIGPQRVFAAVRQLFGYIPGIGIVEQSSGIRVLAKPVSVEKNGITVTVNQVVADATRTFVAYSVVGIPPWDKSGFPICTDRPSLQLADGSILSILSGGGVEIGPDKPYSYVTNATFPPLPANIRQVVFLSPCQMPAIQLNLILAPAGLVTPAVEIAATFESSGPQYSTTTPLPVPEETVPSAPNGTSLPITPTPVKHGSGLNLDQVIKLDNAYILAGNFTDAGDLPGVLAVDEMTYPLQITDADGQTISYTSRNDIRPAVELGGVWYWAYEIPRPIHGPLTLTLTSIPVHQEDSIQIPLVVGQDPQLGQKWSLNRTVKLGGYDIVIEDITKVENGYSIHFHTDASVPDLVLYFFVAGVDSTQGGGSSNRQPQEVLYSETINFNSPPTGNLTILLTLGKIVQLPGPWTLIWSPPVP